MTESVCKEKCDIVIGTDQNFYLLKLDKHVPTINLNDAFLSNGFIPNISKPTRITHSSATLIDNIYTKSKSQFSCKSAIITADISDHYPVVLFMPRPTKCHKQEENSKVYKEMRILKNDKLKNVTKALHAQTGKL